jgi:heptosyltransferase-3
MNMDKRALLFRVGGLGDLLVALPSISIARRSLAGFSLTLVGRAEYAKLLERTGVVDDILAFEDARVAALFAEPGEAGPSLEWPKGYAVALGWLNRRGHWPPDDWWVGQGFDRILFSSYENARGTVIHRHFFDATCRFFGVDEAAEGLFDECARLPVDERLRTEALHGMGLRRLAPGGRRLVIHPGSGGPWKCWPRGNFLEVVRWAASRGLEGVVVTGEAEGDWESALESAGLPEGWKWAPRPPLERLAGLLAASTHYLGNDSGPTHLAAACGVTVLALFGERPQPAWRPYGRTRVLLAPAVERIRVDAVVAELDHLLAA